MRVLRTVGMVLVLLGPALAQGALVQGAYLGTYAGNDSESVVGGIVNDLTVMELAKVNWPDLSSDGLSIDDLVSKPGDPDEVISGTWAYTGPTLVSYLVVKAGPQFALYDYTGVDQSMRLAGLWDTGDLTVGSNGNQPAMSHITIYSSGAPPATIPIPAAVWLFGSAVLGLVVVARSRRTVPAPA